MRFSTQMLLLQLACVIAVVAICTGVFVWIGVQQLRAEAETSALSIARTVAADADVRAGVATISAEAGTPSNADLVEVDSLRNLCLRTSLRLSVPPRFSFSRS